MGNFHCVTSNCATVVYRKYLPPVIRWRYEGEKWNEIEGDDYSINRKVGQCPVRYDVKYIVYYNRQPFQRRVTGIFGRIQRFLLKPNGFYVIQGLSNKPDAGYHRLIDGGGYYDDFEILSLTRQDNQPDNCGDCFFSITKNGDIVHQVTRDRCPEVEKIPCRLSDEYKNIEIEKLPYLERIEVVDYAYDVRLGLLIDSDNYGLLLAKKKIPNDCLNIYKNNIVSTIPNDFLQIANTSENNYNQITQICSAPGCPPPEYQVMCGCNSCELCPPDTCAVNCGGHICCYDTTTGKSVKQIPEADYCGGAV